MTVLNPRHPHARHRWLAAFLLLATAAAAPLAAPPEGTDADPDDSPDTGFTASGEIRELENASLTLRPWQPRLPARLAVKTSSRTRFLRQKKGRRSDLAVGELVLVVEEPPNKSEKDLRRQAAEVRKQSKTKTLPRRAARARAVVRCWKAESTDVNPENRQIARALLEGARPFFRGEGRGGARPPGEETRLVLGAVTNLEPFTIRSAKRVVEYSITSDTLVLNHAPIALASLKRGENILVQSADAPPTGEAVQAAVVAVTPRPRLKLEQQRRLILRDRRAPDGDGR
jgi:hypothetical protein